MNAINTLTIDIPELTESPLFHLSCETAPATYGETWRTLEEITREQIER